MIDLDAFGMVPKDILMAITSNEKAKRKQLGVTLQELARKSGASLPSLRRFEQKCFQNLFPRLEYKSMEELLNAEHKQR